MQTKWLKMMTVSLLCLGNVMLLVSSPAKLKAEEVYSSTEETIENSEQEQEIVEEEQLAIEEEQVIDEEEQLAVKEEEAIIEEDEQPLSKHMFQARGDINKIWPGQTMMSDEYQLSDTGWTSIKIENTVDSVTSFPINIEGYEDGTLIGHIRFGGVNKETGKFEKDTAKQMRNLIFIVENTKKFKDKEKKVTVKYTYNYYQGTNSTYTMVPITNMSGPGITHDIQNDPYYAFEVPQGGQVATYRTVKELYIQQVPGTDKIAVQARTDANQGTGNLDFYFQQIKTLIPTVDGGVRIVNEIKNTNWRTNMESKFPRKTFGVMLGEDTMLNNVDEVPIFSLGTNKGVYIANNEDLFRVAFPRLERSQGAADNYEGQAYNSILGGSTPAFQKMPDGYGNEQQDLPLDTRVWPANGIKPPLSGNNSDPIDTRGYDTQYAQKWIPREPPEVGEKAILSYDVTVLPIYKPEIKLTAESLNQGAHKDSSLTFNGSWRDLDSLNVTLYYKIGSREKDGWVEFKRDARPDSDEGKLQWSDFSLELPANQFKLKGDTISFKAVDTTRVDSDSVTTAVTTFETVTIHVEHYGPKGNKLAESSFQATPKDTYTTEPNDYTDQGLTLDESKTVGQVSGEVPNEDVLVKYYYKEGLVKVITHYLKDNGEELFPSKEVLYNYNKTYTTDPREAEANNRDYYLDKTIGEPTGPTGKQDRIIEVTYHYRIGSLGIVDAVKAFDFAETNLISVGQKESYPQTNPSIEILDQLQGNWHITLRLSDPLKTESGKKLNGQFFFNPIDGQPVELNESGKPIYRRQKLKGGQYKIEWDTNKKEGLVFNQGPGNEKSTYTGAFEWTIVNGL